MEEYTSLDYKAIAEDTLKDIVKTNRKLRANLEVLKPEMNESHYDSFYRLLKDQIDCLGIFHWAINELKNKEYGKEN